MQIRYVATGVVEHVKNEIGQFAIKSGLATEVVPFIPAPIPNTTWVARKGPRVGDYQYPPHIYFYCSTCGNKGAMEGPTAYETQRFSHCSVAEKCPHTVAEEYVRLRKEYKSRSRVRVHDDAGTPVNYGAEKVAADQRRKQLVAEALSQAAAAIDLCINNAIG